jgi:urease accessory protein
MSAVPAANGWQARLALGFERRGPRTVLARRRHHGPLVVQRPFYPEAGVCHVYLLHPPGGVVGGDELTVDVQCAAGAEALVTTPAATKFYRSGGPVAVQRQNLAVAAGARLEWLPQETIVFAGGRVDTTTRVDLEPGAAFVGWEILCLGRPASGEAFDSGQAVQRLEVWRAGMPLLLDRTRVDSAGPMPSAPWGLAGCAVSATLVATPADGDLLAAVRDGVCVDGDERFGATLLDDLLVCRYLGHHGERARAVFEQIWTLLRPGLAGRPACAPRIWRT